MGEFDEVDNCISSVRQKVENNLNNIWDVYHVARGKTYCKAASLAVDIYNKYSEAYYLFAKHDMFRKAEDFSSAKDCLAGIQTSIKGADDSFKEVKNLACMQKKDYFQRPLAYPTNNGNTTSLQDSPFLNITSQFPL